MNEIIVKIGDLKPSPSNVRTQHSKEDVMMMASSIKRRGLINPLTIAKNGDGRYEVIAGLLRYKGAIAAGVEDVRCLDVTKLTEAERVDISLSENVHRRRMTAIQYWSAFNKLFKAGMPIEKIGQRFNKTEREVQQYLAIGSLPKKILDLAENGKIGDRTLQALAISPAKEVTRYGKLSEKDRPRDWQIQEWLAGDKGMYKADNAIFDLDEYKGPKIVDLFAEEDEVWLTDGTQFVMLQNEAINAKLADYVRKSWICKKLDHWQSWAYEKTSKANGGQVFYTRDDRTQHVEFYVGYARQKATGAEPKAKDDKPKTKPETSKAFDNFMAETRHAAVQFQMINDTRSGLVGTLILLLKQCDNIQFRNGGKPLSDAYSDSLHSSENFIIMIDDYTAMLDELGLKDGHTWDIDIKKLGPKLLEYTPKTLTRWITLVVARNWDCEGKSGDEIGKVIGLTEVNVWEADDAFWNGITNKKTLLKIAKENNITVSDKEPLKIIRKRLQDKVPATWRPSWLKF
jgi:ParB/RepB/Spo0J family partition protein